MGKLFLKVAEFYKMIDLWTMHLLIFDKCHMSNFDKPKNQWVFNIMEKITTSLDQHGRMLIPAQIREKFNIEPGDRVILEMNDDALKILNVNHIVDEMHSIFTKNRNVKEASMVD